MGQQDLCKSTSNVFSVNSKLQILIHPFFYTINPGQEQTKNNGKQKK